MKIYILKRQLRWGLFVLIISGYIYALWGQEAERIAFGIAVAIIVLGTHQIAFLRNKRRYDLMDLSHTIFIFILLLCGILHLSINPVIYGAGMWITYVLLKKCIVVNGDLQILSNLIKVSCLISTIVFLLSFAVTPFSLTSYNGVFENPNTMGAFAATFSTILISDVLEKLSKNHNPSVASLVGYVTSVFCVVISSSRTAFLVVVLQLIVALGFFVICKKVKAKTFFATFVASVASFFVLLKMGFIEIVQNAILEKFFHVMQQGDISNGRTEMWGYIFENAQLFQNGTTVLHMPSHNVYFGLMNQFGKIAAISYFIFILIACFRMFKFSLQSNNCAFRYLPAMAAINFFVVSMAENYLMTSTMLLFYLSFSINELNKKQGNDLSFQQIQNC